MSWVRKQSVYLVLEPTGARYTSGSVWNFRVAGMKKNKPRLAPGQIAVKVSITLDTKIFEDYIPEVSLNVTKEHVIEPEPSAELEVQVVEGP